MERSAFLLSLALIVVVGGCATLEVRLEYPNSAAAHERPSASQQATRIPPNTAARTATSAPISMPGPTSSPATPTEPPTAVPEPQRIQFAEGATSATVTGTLPVDGSDHYVLGALAGQSLSVDIAAPHLILLSIWGADGTFLKRPMAGTTYWNGSLPSTGDYVLELTSTGPETDYHMMVTIPEPTAPLPDMEANTYTDQTHGFEVRLPGDFVEGMTCPTEGIIDAPVVSFQLVGATYYSDTNLLDACVTVGADSSQAARATCREARDPREDTTGQQEISGILFTRINRGGVATGHVYEVTSYRASHSGACYEITLFLHYIDPGVYGTETVSRFDEQAVMSRLEQILHSFRFLR